MTVRFTTDFEAATDDPTDCLPPFDELFDQGAARAAGTRAKIRTDVPGAVSPKAARLVMPPATSVADNNRVLMWPAYRLPYGARRWIGLAMFIGDDWIITNNQFAKDGSRFANLLSITTVGAGPGGGIAIKWDTSKAIPQRFVAARGTNHNWTDGKGEDHVDLGPFIKNEWIYWNHGTLWTNSSSTLDNPNAEYFRKDSTTSHQWKRMGIRTAQTSTQTTTSQQARIGIYEGSAINHQRTIWFDNYRIAGTFAEADPSHTTAPPVVAPPVASFFDDFADGVPNTDDKWELFKSESGGFARTIPTTGWPGWATAEKNFSLDDSTSGPGRLIWELPDLVDGVEYRWRLWNPSQTFTIELIRRGPTPTVLSTLIGNIPGTPIEEALAGWDPTQKRAMLEYGADGQLRFYTATLTGSFGTAKRTITPPISLASGWQLLQQVHLDGAVGLGEIPVMGSVLLEPVSAADRTAPATPAKATAGDTSDGTIPLSWPPNTEPDLSHYEMEVSEPTVEGPGSWQRVGGNLTESRLTVTGLATGKTYAFRHRAVDQNGNASGWSEVLLVPLAASTDQDRPAPPTDFAATAFNRRVVLSATSTVTDFEAFVWEFSVDGGVTWALAGESATVPFTHGDRRNGVTTAYRARVRDTSGNLSDPTATLTRTPRAAAMTALTGDGPENKPHVLPGNGYLRVVWNEPDPEQDVARVLIWAKPRTELVFPSTPIVAGVGAPLGAGKRYADVPVPNGVLHDIQIGPAQ